METTCYHCSQPVTGQYINDDGPIFHPTCYMTAAREESCIECGAAGPAVFIVTSNDTLAAIHGACIADRQRRQLFR